MSEKEVIKFACPHCETRLTVPASLGGVVGPCPKCRESIAAPKPRVPIPAQSKASAPPPIPRPPAAAPLPPIPGPLPYQRQKSSWLALFIPLFFLTLTIGVLVSLFYNLTPKKSAEAPREISSLPPTPPTPPSQPEPVATRPPGPEVEALTPPIPNPDSENEAPENAEFILQAREVLAAFLEARDLAQRRPFLTPSHRGDLALARSRLATALPGHATPTLVHTQSEDGFFKAWFAITFEAPQNAKQKSLVLQTLRKVDGKQTRINTDAFLDADEQKLLKLSRTPTGKIETSTCLITYASFSFDDVPFSDKMALIEFHHSFDQDAPPFAKAYLARTSELFPRIKALGRPGEFIPCSLTVGWELEINPDRPFLKVLQLDSPDWITR